MAEYDDAYFLGVNNDKVYKKDNFSHFMTITGVVDDKQAGNTYYIASSWGEKYIVNSKILTYELNGTDKLGCGIRLGQRVCY